MNGQVLLNQYRVVKQLDEGGMSKVYLARQTAPAREVIVKVLKEHLRTQTKAVEHFRREIYISSRFKHAFSVDIFDSMPKGPFGPVLVMEYLRGTDMCQVLAKDGRFSVDRTGRILAQLCDVLNAAHEQGIVHRDLKPGNLMVLNPGNIEESVKLMDYGLAKMSSMLYISPDEIFDFTLPPASGTPEYISPEMVRGSEMDGRADLYSLGVMIYEMLTGRRPFTHSRVEDLMMAHAEEPPPSFAKIGLPNLVPPAVEAVVMSCLAKYPEQRPKTAWDVIVEYQKALNKRFTQGRGSNNGLQQRPPVNAPPKPTAPAAVDRNAFRHSVEANMPEVMAMIKLKGFVGDLGGEILESVPGMIKVRIVEAQTEKKASGVFAWVTGSKQVPTLKRSGVTDLELHMERKDPTQTSKLTITLVMRPAGGLATPEWRNKCERIQRDLQAFLMGR
jgi:serine/threonine-protein kinase